MPPSMTTPPSCISLMPVLGAGAAAKLQPVLLPRSWLPVPWDMVLGCCVPVAFFLKLSWDMAKSRLERLEMLEKRLLDQLASMD